jgi:hypothetical protein
MAINETVTGQNSIAITGAAQAVNPLGYLVRVTRMGCKPRGANGVFAKGKVGAALSALAKVTSGGGACGSIGVRGPGETKLEVDRRVW